jgi:hypothetical protein
MYELKKAERISKNIYRKKKKLKSLYRKISDIK